MNQVYSELDSFSIFRLVFDEIERMNLMFHQTFFTFNQDPVIKRIQRKESDLLNEFWMQYQVSILQKKN